MRESEQNRRTCVRRNWPLRVAQERDIPELKILIEISVRKLQAPYYSAAQMDAALGPVFDVDRQLIQDRTYFAVEDEGCIVGCGGWSKRRASYGGDRDRIGEDELLNPKHDAARIRAFFVHPKWARWGIGTHILEASEEAIQDAGFQSAVLVATLAGEPLYAKFGYSVVERYDVPLGAALTLPVVRMTKRIES